MLEMNFASQHLRFQLTGLPYSRLGVKMVQGNRSEASRYTAVNVQKMVVNNIRESGSQSPAAHLDNQEQSKELR